MEFVRVYDNALPEELCDKLIQTFEAHSGVEAGKTGAGVDASKKRSRDLTLDQFADLAPLKNALLNNTFTYLKQYLAEFPQAFVGAIGPTVLHPATQQPVALSLDNFANVGTPYMDSLIQQILRCGIQNIQKYDKGVGGYPHWHSEIYPQDQFCEPLHRLLFYIYYLNDVEDGGETEFLLQETKVKPKKGRMIISPAGFTHTHRGNPPMSNDKYIVASWIMFNRAEVLYGNS